MKNTQTTCLGLIAYYLLNFWCIFGALSLIRVLNWFEFLIPYIILLLPFSIFLYYLSYKIHVENNAYNKFLSMGGKCISFISAIVPIIWLIYFFFVY